LDVLRAEMMKLQQKMAELDINRRAMLDVLGVLLDRELPDSTHLTKPAETGLPAGPGQRPEHQLYELQKNQLQAAENLTGVKNYPKVFAFGQAGYGKPGLNMLSEDFDTYYIVGAGLKWTFWDWNTVEREKQVLQIQRDMVDDQRNTFDQVQNMQVQKEQAEIARYREMIERDEEIIELRQKITRSAKSQFEHGVITATEYLTELNAETRARIELETHKLQLVQATYKLQIINGN
jgi:outer membrane protein TolC